jgi:hypothetical protein
MPAFQTFCSRAFERLRAAARRVARFLNHLGAMLSEPVLGYILDGYTLKSAPPFRRVRALLQNGFGRVLQGGQRARIFASASLVLLAAVMTAAHPRPPMALMCAGMGLSFLGDAMLMQYAPIRSMVRQYFLWGEGCFAAAQALYLTGLRQVYVRASDNTLWPIQLISALFVALAVGVMLRLVLFRRGQPLVLRVGATLYAVLVGAMAGSAVATCLATAGRGWPLLLGGPLFLISDLLVALNDFGGMHMDNKDVWVWVTYVPAQALLILGVAALV